MTSTFEVDGRKHGLHVVGVRHHSPACAALVRRVIERERPKYVLIEGPADFNARIEELFLGHALPIAIFTHFQDRARRHVSWTPFCEYSPEWVALETARAVNAQPRFCDLPAWHEAFSERQNRYGEGALRDARERARSERILRELVLRTATDDLDSLWDHLFEQPDEPHDPLEERLRFYFRELRGEASGGDRDTPRETLMAEYTAWALQDAQREGKSVVVVCGGWHAPVLERDALSLVAEGIPRIEPSITRPPPKDEDNNDIRAGSDLVPYAYRRLDAFTGYESGMPSPAYHEWVWTMGHERAADRVMEVVSTRVRQKKQPLSTADLIAARSLTRALSNLRGHAVTMRVDVLDGLAGALVKDALDVPAPWAHRGTLQARTEPILREVALALSGDKEGKLAAGTPRPPLAANVREELARVGITLTSTAARIATSLRDAHGRDKSRVLHRLLVLGIPGFERVAGPAWATDPSLEETWSVVQLLDQDGALIEASQWGATLEGAALAKLESRLLEAHGRLSLLAEVLGAAAFIGIRGLEDRVMREVSAAIGNESSLSDLGAAAGRLFDLSLHGELFDAAQAVQLDWVLGAAFERGLWLLEGTMGADAALDEGQLKAVVVMRDLLQRGPSTVSANRLHAEGVFARRAVDKDAPSGIRGACLGALWSLDRLGDVETSKRHAGEAVRASSLPQVLGDFLAGLFSTARVQVLEADELVEVIDEVITQMEEHEMLVALPSLRLAFSYFPPKERERIADAVVGIHGGTKGDARRLVQTLTIAPAEIARGIALNEAARTRSAAFGLLDALDMGASDEAPS